MSEIISRDELVRLMDAWRAEGRRVVAPVDDPPGTTRFARLDGSRQPRLDGYIHPVNTAKELVLPKSEKLYSYVREGKEVTLTDHRVDTIPTVLVGARPCDAAAFPIMDKVMNWDYHDSQYNQRRAALTVITLACREWDEHCFCTGVDPGPAVERGSDAILLDLGDGTYEVRVVTGRGHEALGGHTHRSDRVAETPGGPAPRVDLPRALAALKEGVDSVTWQVESLRCLGCGACTYTCPTCHCFDIVDEAHGTGGCRRRNWDACQFQMFTAHASGHNPRANQAARQRQRLTHKFVIYPEKFGDYLCTGCGNCYRNCPVSLGVLNILKAATRQPTGAEGHA